ncbi:uncharacterized protein MELLADRAFT_61416 [Melampsora larici-populina 98AG31]|uniref:Uncharacterized protein n=1 Tax=Melampsora larici-populina (strain 98AG31 / pathotype 3-4-7) TaxID=747676 RepID=F4RET8_MELLP|nr:uncharacterized protein MELLADRAFT_61416 [Melampsora larici-populina 98AG31]EGG09160.1 hypothetical protein MELLADRAFT_61416 [Melampsora larici-populina 98AG31]
MTMLSSWSPFRGSMHPGEVYGPSTVNKHTFAPMNRSSETRAGRTRATLWGIVKLSTPPSDPIPHCDFFRDSKLVMESTSHIGIKALSEKVLVLLSTLTSYPESWHNWLERNDQIVIECLDLAQQALGTEIDWEIDRLWAVGIVAALTTNVPSYSDRLRERLSSLSWTNQVTVEIEMTKARCRLKDELHVPFAIVDFEAATTYRYKCLRHRGKDHEPATQYDGAKECLERAALFAHYDAIRVKRLPTRESKVYGIISQYLLRSTLPEEEEQVEKIDSKHLFNKPLKEDLTDHRRPPNIGTTQFLLENCKRALSNLMFDKAAAFLKPLILQTLIHPCLEFDVMEFMNSINDVTQAAQVWSKLFPNLVPKEIGFGEYQWIFAQKTQIPYWNKYSKDLAESLGSIAKPNEILIAFCGPIYRSHSSTSGWEADVSNEHG